MELRILQNALLSPLKESEPVKGATVVAEPYLHLLALNDSSIKYYGVAAANATAFKPVSRTHSSTSSFPPEK